jgi:hypothetical protein
MDKEHREKIVLDVARLVLATLKPSYDVRKDGNGRPTLGYYHPVNPSLRVTGCSEKEALGWLMSDISLTLNKVITLCTSNPHTTDSQLIAITSYLLFSPDIGYDNTSFIHYHQKGDYKRAVPLLKRHREIGGCVYPVGEVRRTREIKLYTKDIDLRRKKEAHLKPL